MRQASTLFRLGIAQRLMIAAACIAVIWVVTLMVVSS
jgi:hypothetical protein